LGLGDGTEIIGPSEKSKVSNTVSFRLYLAFPYNAILAGQTFAHKKKKTDLCQEKKREIRITFWKSNKDLVKSQWTKRLRKG